jgi:hypothetical protein
MPKAKSWILVLMFAAGLMLVACGQTKNRLQVVMDEAGWYAVDVAKYIAVKDPTSGEVTHYPTYFDGTADLKFSYLGSMRALPTFPADDAIRLTTFRVRWTGAAIPTTSGSLDNLIQADPLGKTTIIVPILVVPAGVKESCAVLTDLQGDPDSDPNTFVGQLQAKGIIEIHGKDIMTDEDISATVEFTAAFADYVEPNSAH